MAAFKSLLMYTPTFLKKIESDTMNKFEEFMRNIYE